MDFETTRKCQSCKENIVLEHHDCLVSKKFFFHNDCFIKKLTDRKRSPMSIDEAKEMVLILTADSASQVDEAIILNHLYRWIQRTYDVVVLPKYFYQKMSSIYDGSFRGLSRGIPAKHILDMMKRKRRELVRINNYNRRKGNIIEGINLINYDIAIIINKYDHYLRWLKRQDTLRKQNEQDETFNSGQKINYEKITSTKTSADNSKIDISKIVDEV